MMRGVVEDWAVDVLEVMEGIVEEEVEARRRIGEAFKKIDEG